jgi:hypothetical protein
MIEFSSNNGFDRSVEAISVATIVIGPIGAVVGLIGGWILGGQNGAPIG